MVSIQITLTEHEFRILKRLAQQEHRDPPKQAEVMIREELNNCDFADDTPTQLAFQWSFDEIGKQPKGDL
jgi:hypothetical protein